jgi:hypothetical protein
MAMTARLPEMEEPRWGGPLLPGAIVLDAEELRQAGDALIPGEDPEEGWIRYLRALALLALRRWLKQRKASVVVGPEIEPEDPDRLLAIGGRATQLLCTSALAEEVAVPLKPWEQIATAPQLALLALVDEENGVVEFPGVLDAAGMVAELRKLRDCGQEALEVPVVLFEGGLERLLRWVTLLGPDALPRAGLSGMANAGLGARSVSGGLQQWLAQVLSSSTLIPLPVIGTRGGGAPMVRLITPGVKLAADGSLIAETLCSNPSIWADTPLAEVLIEHEERVVWQRLATRQKPIEGPIAWPLEPLLPRQRLTIRLRPYGAAGGAFARLTLITPDAAAMERGEEQVQQGLRELRTTITSTTEECGQQGHTVIAEIRAREWLVAQFIMAEDI